MLLLFASDLHGHRRLYEQLLGVIRESRPDLVLLGGDLLPKDVGIGHLHRAQKRFIEHDLAELLRHFIHVWPGMEIGLMQGNDDLCCLRPLLAVLERQGLCRLMDQQEWVTGKGLRVIGLNLVPETPFGLKDWERLDVEASSIRFPWMSGLVSHKHGFEHVEVSRWLRDHLPIGDELDRFQPLKEPRKTIFVSHAPPRNTRLDVLYTHEHIGSLSVRDFILRNEPLLSLHGHIHESYHMSGSYFDRLGETLCFNPGQYRDSLLDALLVDTDDPSGSHEHTRSRWEGQQPNGWDS